MGNTKICHLELVGLLKVSKTKFLNGGGLDNVQKLTLYIQNTLDG